MPEQQKDFDEFIRRLIVGAPKVLFRDVIKSSTGNDILEVKGEWLSIAKKIKDYLNSHLSELSEELKKGYKGRANEVSNYLEPLIAKQLSSISEFEISIPAVQGKKRSAGYPDRFLKAGDHYMYVEIKTFQEKTEDSSLRSFYYKPSEQNKVTLSCPHLLIGAEVESLGGENKSPFVIKRFKIMDLYNLKVDLKPEFNASNPMIYQSCKEI